ncbi:MAG: class I SAM-dependent methyltransferase [Microthrixaceae bacterium]
MSNGATQGGPAVPSPFDRLAAAGHLIHAEAGFVMGFGPRTVLVAGCGAGRVAIELFRRGVTVVGVDSSLALLQDAAAAEPGVEWFRSDLDALSLPDPDSPSHLRLFDMVLVPDGVDLRGRNPSDTALAAMMDHLVDGGFLVVGLARPRDAVTRHDLVCTGLGMVPEARFASWTREPWRLDSGYAVCVHRRPIPD